MQTSERKDPREQNPSLLRSARAAKQQQITFERSREARRRGHARSLRGHVMGSSRACGAKLSGDAGILQVEVGGGPSRLDIPKQDHQSPLWKLTPVSAPVLPGNIQHSGAPAGLTLTQENHRYSQKRRERH